MRAGVSGIVAIRKSNSAKGTSIMPEIPASERGEDISAIIVDSKPRFAPIG
jgi:hypothetical protein